MRKKLYQKHHPHRPAHLRSYVKLFKKVILFSYTSSRWREGMDHKCIHCAAPLAWDSVYYNYSYLEAGHTQALLLCSSCHGQKLTQDILPRYLNDNWQCWHCLKPLARHALFHIEKSAEARHYVAYVVCSTVCYKEMFSTAHERNCEPVTFRECRKCEALSAKMSHCGRCRTVYYCSAECQKADWPVHKSTCGR